MKHYKTNISCSVEKLSVTHRQRRDVASSRPISINMKWRYSTVLRTDVVQDLAHYLKERIIKSQLYSHGLFPCCSTKITLSSCSDMQLMGGSGRLLSLWLRRLQPPTTHHPRQRMKVSYSHCCSIFHTQCFWGRSEDENSSPLHHEVSLRSSGLLFILYSTHEHTKDGGIA